MVTGVQTCLFRSALVRLERAGLITCTARTGAGGRTRRILTITDAGRERLHELLRSPAREEMEAMPAFLGVLAFLSHLPDAAERRAVLRRRLQILQDGPPSFFYDEDGRPRRAAAEPDPYRRGMTLIAGAARREEIAWLRRILSDDTGIRSLGWLLLALNLATALALPLLAALTNGGITLIIGICAALILCGLHRLLG